MQECIAFIARKTCAKHIYADANETEGKGNGLKYLAPDSRRENPHLGVANQTVQTPNTCHLLHLPVTPRTPWYLSISQCNVVQAHRRLQHQCPEQKHKTTEQDSAGAVALELDHWLGQVRNRLNSLMRAGYRQNIDQIAA